MLHKSTDCKYIALNLCVFLTLSPMVIINGRRRFSEGQEKELTTGHITAVLLCLKVSSAHRDCIYLIKNTVKIVKF